MNEYDVLIEIFQFIRDYAISTYTLPDVCRRLVKFLEGAGYQVQVLDEKHRDYKIIQVENQKYKIIRNQGWTTYDGIMTA